MISSPDKMVATSTSSYLHDNGSSTFAATTALSRPEDAAYFITVTDPVQHSEGMNKYTSYRVQVRPPNNHVNSNNSNPHSTAHHEGDIFPSTGYSAVLRRYSDFLWLHSALQKERAGAILPPLPEKQAVSRFSLSFIEERRGLLERFLRRVAVHPELYDSVSLDTFLRADDATFFAAKNSKGMTPSSSSSLSSSYHHPGYDVPPSSNPHNNNMAMSAAAHYPSPYGGASVMGSSQGGMMTSPLPPKKKEGIKKWFAETKTSIAGELVRSPDDDLFVEIERYVEGLEKQIKQVQTQASSLVKKNKEIANGLFEFGIAFNILGQSEADDLGKALSQMGAAADELSSVSLAHSEKEMLQFEEPLKDYLKTIHSVKAALQKRHEKRLTYTTCLSEVNTKRTNLAKLRATPGAEAKAYGAEMSLRRGEAATNAARDDFATVSQRVLREVDRFKREKGDEMRRVILDYINLQIEYNKKMEQVWADLLPKLEAIQSLHGDDVDSSGCDDGTSDLPPSNVVTTTEKDEVHDFSNSNQVPGVIQQHQQQQQPSLAQYGMSHQNMFGLESSIQYRDTTDIVSGM